MMTKKLLFLSVPLLLFAKPPTLNLMVDRYFSPYVGAEELLTLSTGVQYVENWAIKKPNPPTRSWAASFGRLGELLLFWTPYNYLSTVAQHEVFGHGYRVRTFQSDGASVRKYSFGTPPPYGFGGGATAFTLEPDEMTPFQFNAITIAGVEATSILAIRLKLQWLQSGMINAVQTSLYQYCQQDLATYIRGTEDEVPFLGSGMSGDDIQDYVEMLHATLPKGDLSIKRLKRLALLNYADPFTYYSIYALWHYLISGKQMRIPMIRMGGYGYLLGLRMGLTPYGPEYYLENFLVQAEQPIYFYLRGGKYAGLRSYGLGIEHAYLWTVDQTPWGLRADVWLQPNVPYAANASNNLDELPYFQVQKKYTSRWGGALSLIGHIRLSGHTSIFFQVGGKTTGFLPGETLSASLIARLGLTFF